MAAGSGGASGEPGRTADEGAGADYGLWVDDAGAAGLDDKNRRGGESDSEIRVLILGVSQRDPARIFTTAAMTSRKDSGCKAPTTRSTKSALAVKSLPGRA